MVTEADWRTTVLAAATLLVAFGVIWRYAIAPIGVAIWAAILAAPQIAEDLRDLPDLIDELRKLVAGNVIGEIAAIKADVAAIKIDLATLRTPVISGGEGSGEEPFLMDEDALREVRERLGRYSHIPDPPSQPPPPFPRQDI